MTPIKSILLLLFCAISLLGFAQNKPKGTSTSSGVSTTSSQPIKYKYVDLGLPSGTLWADKNVGANSPEAYGSLFRYGKPGTKLSGDDGTCSKEQNTIGTSEDIAMAKMGKNWRMPSIVQVVELYQCCKVGKESVNGKTVTRFTGPNGNSIILPWAGIMYNYGRSQAGEFGFYQVGSRDSNGADCTWHLDAYSEYFRNWGNDWGGSVRGVYYTARSSTSTKVQPSTTNSSEISVAGLRILNYSPIALYGLSSAALSAQSSYNEMLKSMCDEYNKKLLDLDKNKSSLPETIFSFRVDELKSMKSRIESFRETAITEIKKY